ATLADGLQVPLPFDKCLGRVTAEQLVIAVGVVPGAHREVGVLIALRVKLAAQIEAAQAVIKSDPFRQFDDDLAQVTRIKRPHRLARAVWPAVASELPPQEAGFQRMDLLD